jgi:hypothetical protein
MRSFPASLTAIVIAAISITAAAAPAPVAELNARHFNSQVIKQLEGTLHGIPQADGAAEQSAIASASALAAAVSIANEEEASPTAAAAFPVASSFPSVAARQFNPFKALESLSLGLVPPEQTSALLEEIEAFAAQALQIAAR